MIAHTEAHSPKEDNAKAFSRILKERLRLRLTSQSWSQGLHLGIAQRWETLTVLLLRASPQCAPKCFVMRKSAVICSLIITSSTTRTTSPRRTTTPLDAWSLITCQYVEQSQRQHRQEVLQQVEEVPQSMLLPSNDLWTTMAISLDLSQRRKHSCCSARSVRLTISVMRQNNLSKSWIWSDSRTRWSKLSHRWTRPRYH